MPLLQRMTIMKKQQDDYVIQVDGWLDAAWSDWWKGMLVIPSPDDTRPATILQGTVPDQAALRGILNQLWDLNLSIISVNRVERQV